LVPFIFGFSQINLQTASRSSQLPINIDQKACFVKDKEPIPNIIRADKTAASNHSPPPSILFSSRPAHRFRSG